MPLCAKNLFKLGAIYDSHLNQRMRIFRKVTKTKKTLLPTFITPNGLLNNMYARKIPRDVKGDQLFG